MNYPLLLEIDHVEADIAAEAHVGNAVSTIHCIWKDTLSSGFTHRFNLVKHILIIRIKDRQHPGCTKIEIPAVNANQAIVGLTTNTDMFYNFAVFRIEH